MRWKWAAALAGVLVLGSAVYGWGIGLFYVCGPIQRVFNGVDCRILTAVDGGPMETLLVLPNGNLLTVLRDDGPDPQNPQRLAEISMSDGRLVREVALADLPADANWMDAALSPNGQMMAASFLDERVGLIDVVTGKLLRRIGQFYSVAMVDFVDDDSIMMDRGNVSSERPPAQVAQVFSVADGQQQDDIAGPQTLPLYRDGLASALSPDGAHLAQHLTTLAESGVVGIRLADAKFADWGSALLVAPLGAWLQSGQVWPTLWFSPDGKYIAASFDGAPVWGKDTAALIIWDVETRKVVQRIPTYHADWHSLVWIEGKKQVAVSRFNVDDRRAEIALINY